MTKELRENNLPDKSCYAERKATLISAQRLTLSGDITYVRLNHEPSR